MSDLPRSATGLKLFRIANERLIACESVQFIDGYPAVETTLRRAAISGLVEVGGDLQDHFADVLDRNGSIVENVALDRHSYRALKTRWMRCKTEPSP